MGGAPWFGCCCCCTGAIVGVLASGGFDCAALSARRELGSAPPDGGGKFFLLIQTIRCMAMANSNLSSLLSTGERSTIFQMSLNVAGSTPDFMNKATASGPYTKPSGLAYWGNKASYRARSCGVMEYGSGPTNARLDAGVAEVMLGEFTCGCCCCGVGGGCWYCCVR